MSERSADDQANIDALQIREATAADLPALVILLADDALGAFREQTSEEGLEAYELAMAQIQAQAGNRILVAVLGDEVVGCLQLTVIPGLAHRGASRAQIESVRIDSHLRGHGLGEKMMRQAIDIAATEGCRIVQLTTDRSRADAHRFYQRLGFRVTHMGLKLELSESPGQRAQGPGGLDPA